jgi:hypothetical protein
MEPNKLARSMAIPTLKSRGSALQYYQNYLEINRFGQICKAEYCHNLSKNRVRPLKDPKRRESFKIIILIHQISLQPKEPIISRFEQQGKQFEHSNSRASSHS